MVGWCLATNNVDQVRQIEPEAGVVLRVDILIFLLLGIAQITFYIDKL